MLFSEGLISAQSDNNEHEPRLILKLSIQSKKKAPQKHSIQAGYLKLSVSSYADAGSKVW